MSTQNAEILIKLVLAVFTVFACAVLLSACRGGGSSDDGSSGAGSVAFRLVLAETENQILLRQVVGQHEEFDCEENGIDTIIVQVLNENGALLVEGSFDCEAHGGTVDGVPAGNNRFLVVDANDESGRAIFRGWAEGLTIIGGMITNAGTIALERLNNIPLANAGPDQTYEVGEWLEIGLDGSGSSDADGQLLTYYWSLITVPEGSQATLSDPTAVRPTFFVDQPGDYVAQLIVNDGIEDSEPDTVGINWLNSPPVAIAWYEDDQTANVGDTVTLDGSYSYDVDGQLLTYYWSLITVPEGSEATLSAPAAVRPTFFADQPGDYVAQLIVNDGIEDSEPDTVSIQISAPPAYIIP